jgi:hypothetical protein
MTEAKESKGRVRRWLDRRRASQRRGAEMAERARATRKEHGRKAARHGNIGTGDPGAFGGGG